MISKLTEEKTSAMQQNQKLRQELVGSDIFMLNMFMPCIQCLTHTHTHNVLTCGCTHEIEMQTELKDKKIQIPVHGFLSFSVLEFLFFFFSVF